METYLVRLKKNAELVGLFVCPDVDTLWDYVDECCEPTECEYRPLPPGGLFLSMAGAPRVPTVWDPEREDGPDWFAGATISELWIEIFDWEEGEDGWTDVSVL